MISVIIPIYNAAQYLPQVLHNLKEQSERELEILLMDDGSTDGSAEICKSAEQEDVRMHYFYQENAGVSAARNRALSLASGEYIAFLDADDAIDTNYFEEFLHACRDADIAVLRVPSVGEGGTGVRHHNARFLAKRKRALGKPRRGVD